jgi:predicted transcriptional regulator
MIQLEFASFRNLFRSAVEACKRRPPKQATSAIDYTLRLSAALRIYNLTHAIHDVMCAVAKLESEKGHATIPSICLRLACTYQAVMQHFIKNPDIFLRDERHKPARYTLTPEGIRLLHKIKTRISKT